MRLDPGFRNAVELEFAAIQHLATELIAAEIRPLKPTRLEVGAISRQGYPWNVLAAISERLRLANDKVEDLARELLMPDPEIRWRLFHLAILGVVLVAAKAAGAAVASLGPLSGTNEGPAYRLVAPSGAQWDVWFEAGASWGYYGKVSPYSVATRPLGSAARPLGADIMLRCEDGRALIVECKYSSDPAYVGHRGLTQVLAYAAEARSGLASTLEAYVVAPVGVFEYSAAADTAVGLVGLKTVPDLASKIRKLMGGAD